MSSTSTYPHDIEACHRLLREKDALVSQQNRQLEEQKTELAKAIAERDLALQLAFRKRVERYTNDPKQFIIDFGDSPDVVDAAEGIADAALETIEGYERQKKNGRKPRNEQLPAHLPRYEVTLDVPEDQKFCPEHGERRVIGHERLETLEMVPISLRVRVTLIPKLACPKASGCGVVEAPRPTGLVEGNRFGTSVAAAIIAAKYGYHTPIYRQQDVFASSGWTPAPLRPVRQQQGNDRSHGGQRHVGQDLHRSHRGLEGLAQQQKHADHGQ